MEHRKSNSEASFRRITSTNTGTSLGIMEVSDAKGQINTN